MVGTLSFLPIIKFNSTPHKLWVITIFIVFFILAWWLQEKLFLFGVLGDPLYREWICWCFQQNRLSNPFFSNSRFIVGLFWLRICRTWTILWCSLSDCPDWQSRTVVPVFRQWLTICQLFVKTILRSGFSTDNEFRLEASVEPGNIDDRAVTGKKDGLRVDPPLVNGDMFPCIDMLLSSDNLRFLLRTLGAGYPRTVLVQ